PACCRRSLPCWLTFFLIAGVLPGGAPFRTRFCVQFPASARPATYCHVILAPQRRFPAAPFPAACPSALTSSSLGPKLPRFAALARVPLPRTRFPRSQRK